MNDIMDFRSPSEKVFAMDELTEVILGFLPKQQMGTTKLLELRTVNKCWRKALLPVLIDHCFFLHLDISSETSLHQCIKCFPSDTYLPVHIQVSNEFWSRDQLTFLKDYARVITGITFENMPAFSMERSIRLGSMTTSFPRLAKLEVSPPPGSLYLPPTEASGNLIQRILNNTKKLQLFGLVVPKDDHNENTDVPDGLTYLDFRGSFWTDEICQVFMAADTSKIKFLSIDVDNDNTANGENPIGKFASKIISNLEELKIGVCSRSEYLVPIQIPAASKLQSLHLKNVVLEIEPKSLCQLVNLKIVGPMYNVLDNLEKLIRASTKYAKLEALNLSIIDIDDVVELNDEFVDRIIQVLLQTFKLCPNLQDFEANFVMHKAAPVIFPALFQHQHKLKRIYVELMRVDEKFFDLSSLLTGIPILEFPSDRAKWRNMKGPRNASIADLQCLEYLQLVNTDVEEVQVSDVVFGALSMISSLKSVVFTGNFQMNTELAKMWLNRKSDRSFYIENYDKDIFDERIWTIGLNLV